MWTRPGLFRGHRVLLEELPDEFGPVEAHARCMRPGVAAAMDEESDICARRAIPCPALRGVAPPLDNDIQDLGGGLGLAAIAYRYVRNPLGDRASAEHLDKGALPVRLDSAVEPIVGAVDGQVGHRTLARAAVAQVNHPRHGCDCGDAVPEDTAEDGGTLRTHREASRVDAGEVDAESRADAVEERLDEREVGVGSMDTSPAELMP